MNKLIKDGSTKTVTAHNSDAPQPLPADHPAYAELTALLAVNSGAAGSVPVDDAPLSTGLRDQLRIMHEENDRPPLDPWDAQRPGPNGRGRLRGFDR